MADIRLGITIDSSGVVKGAVETEKRLTSIERASLGVANTFKSMGSRMVRALKGVYNSIFSLKGLLAGVGVGLLAKSFVEAASTSENLRLRINTLLGSVSEGNRLFKQMSEFAGAVPFEYENIMSAATQLAGVMAGGVDEVQKWMPIIGDLAAVTGLSIETSTEQIVRMLSAGAASADLFRERGVTAMLGFTAGVQYTAGETRDQLLRAFEDPASKFRGATERLAQTWTGIMSMMADKWFQFRVKVMEEGTLGSFFKALAQTIDLYMGRALKDLTINGDKWAKALLGALESVTQGVTVMTGSWYALQVVWATLKAKFFEFVAPIIEGVQQLDQTLFQFFDRFGMAAADKPRDDLQVWSTQLGASLFRAKEELNALLTQDPSSAIAGMQAFQQQVSALFQQIESDRVRALTTTGGDGGGNSPMSLAELEDFRKSVENQELHNQQKLALNQELLSATELANIDFWNRKTELETLYLEDESVSLQQYQAWKEQLVKQHEERVTDITRREARTRKQVTISSLSSLAGILGSIGDIIDNGDKDRFEKAKKWSRAQALLSGAVAIMRAWELPWPANAAAITAATIATAAQLTAINRSQFGGGGSPSSSSAPSVTAGAPPSAVAPQSDGGGGARSEVRIEFLGDIYGWDEYVRGQIIDGIRTAVKDYDVILIDEDSNNGRRLAQGG